MIAIIKQSFHQVAIGLFLGLLGLMPFSVMAAPIEFSEGPFVEAPEPIVEGAETSAEDLLRQQLIAMIIELQTKLRTQLKTQALAIPNDGESRSFDVGTKVVRAEGIMVEVDGSSVRPYIYDGNDIDDDSLQFQVELSITNTNPDKHLIIDRNSIAIVAGGTGSFFSREVYYRTGHQSLTADYTFAADDKKVLMIKPGQTALIVPVHAHQFLAPGEYRGQLGILKYTHDTVTFDAEANQIKRGNRVYELDDRDLSSLVINKPTLLVDTRFVDERVEDNKYNFETFSDPSVPFTFAYPEEMTLTESRQGFWTVSYEGLPYIEVSDENNFDRILIEEEIEEEVTVLDADRVIISQKTVEVESVPAVMIEITSATHEDYFIRLFEYPNNISFSRYSPAAIFNRTIEIER